MLAIVAGVIGVAAVWTRPALGRSWLRIPAAAAVIAGAAAGLLLGWRGAGAAVLGVLAATAAQALGSAAAPAVVLLALGLGGASGALPVGYDQASWQAHGINASVLAGSIGLTAILARGFGEATGGMTHAAVCAAALATAILVAALTATVANRPDAVALAVTYGSATVAAGAVLTLVGRWFPLSAPVVRVAAPALAILGCWWATGWFDPVLLTAEGDPLAPRAAFPAIALGIAAAAALPSLPAAAGPRRRIVALVTVAVMAAGAAIAGAYGAGVALVGLTAPAKPLAGAALPSALGAAGPRRRIVALVAVAAAAAGAAIAGPYGAGVAFLGLTLTAQPPGGIV